MEGFSKITRTRRNPVSVEIRPYMMDHSVRGHAVLAAVEAMEVLAASVKKAGPEVDVSLLTDAGFDKFLYLPAAIDSVSAFVDLSFYDTGDVTASLVTKTTSAKSAISRIKEHAKVSFSAGPADLPEPPSQALSLPETGVLNIPAEEIYSRIVPFGPAYQNVTDVLRVFETGAIGTLRAPEGLDKNQATSLLGSPFPLDAAFHAACVWGRKFARFTSFPIGFERRVIFQKTRPGGTYFTRVVPVEMQPNLLIFDLWIYDPSGGLMECVNGLRMIRVT